MVINNQQLDLIFGALADNTRREILLQLSKEGEANVSRLSRPHRMSQPAISKHLKVLERAGLIERQKRGREQIVRVKIKQASQAADWIAYYTKFWSDQFDAVDAYIKEAKTENSKRKPKP
ncbi:MAG: metalloregulator ArsR/SmtB family transcription factor [Planctomycetota bacterium]